MACHKHVFGTTRPDCKSDIVAGKACILSFTAPGYLGDLSSPPLKEDSCEKGCDRGLRTSRTVGTMRIRQWTSIGLLILPPPLCRGVYNKYVISEGTTEAGNTIKDHRETIYPSRNPNRSLTVRQDNPSNLTRERSGSTSSTCCSCRCRDRLLGTG